jgi:hypothetical protein
MVRGRKRKENKDSVLDWKFKAIEKHKSWPEKNCLQQGVLGTAPCGGGSELSVEEWDYQQDWKAFKQRG